MLSTAWNESDERDEMCMLQSRWRGDDRWVQINGRGHVARRDVKDRFTTRRDQVVRHPEMKHEASLFETVCL